MQVDPGEARRARACSSRTCASVISAATVDAPKGSINGPTRSCTIYDNDQLLKAAPWNDVVVAYKNGAPVRIRDIGVAVDGPENTLIDGVAERPPRHPVADLQAAGRECHRDRAARQGAAAARAGAVPPSIKVEQIVDRTTTIQAFGARRRIHLLLTIALVVMVIFLFLRNAWATIIPGVTVPLALLGTAAHDVLCSATAWTICR